MRSSPKIFTDTYFLECIRLAQLSKSNTERQGAVLVNGRILGCGYNRAIAHPTFKLERYIKQGYANHAEIEAINDALFHGYDVEGADIYVSGFFPGQDGLLFLHSEFTCVRCIPIMKKWGIKTLFVSSTKGWLSKTIDKAHAEAISYLGGTLQNRLQSVKTDWKLSDITDHL